VLKAECDLEPLAACLPQDEKQLKNYRLTIPTRSVHWGVPWSIVEDSMLLVGMLTHGMGNWEAVKNNHSLFLTSKVLRCLSNLNYRRSNFSPCQRNGSNFGKFEIYGVYYIGHYYSLDSTKRKR